MNLKMFLLILLDSGENVYNTSHVSSVITNSYGLEQRIKCWSFLKGHIICVADLTGCLCKDGGGRNLLQ